MGKKSGAGVGSAWEKNQEPEPEQLKKKSGAGAGAGAAKKLAGFPALAAIIKCMSIYLSYSPKNIPIMF